MYIYFICLILVFLAFLYEEKILFLKNLRFNDNYLFWFIALILGIISACRYNVGMDYQTYVTIYMDSSITVKEIGFNLINNFSHICGFTAQFTIACYSFATIYFAFRFIQDHSKRPFLSVLIFYAFSPFFLQSLNVVRQMLAVFIMAYSLKFIINKKIIAYFFTIICGSFFAHQTILIALPFYFIFNMNLTKRMKLIFTLFSIFSGPLILKILEISPYSFYIEMINSQGITNILSVTFILELLLSIFTYFKIKKYKISMVYKNMSFVLMCFCIFLIVNSNSIVGVLLERIMWYFLPIILITIPYICDSNEKFKNQYKIVFCSTFIILFSMSIIINGVANKIVPYQTFFNNF